MGEWTAVSIRFGGKITAVQLLELAEAIFDDGGWDAEDYDGQAEDIDEVVRDLKDSKTFLARKNYGNIDELVAKIPDEVDYFHWSDSGPEWAETLHQRAAGRYETCHYADGDALIPLRMITDKDQMARGWADLIDLARFWAQEFPKLEIVR